MITVQAFEDTSAHGHFHPDSFPSVKLEDRSHFRSLPVTALPWEYHSVYQHLFHPTSTPHGQLELIQKVRCMYV